MGGIGGGKGGGGDKVSYSQSPEQAAVYNAIWPTLQNITARGNNGMAAWPTPQAPTTTADNLLPNQQWYSNLSTEVKAGLNAPYDEARQQLLENFGSSGAVGSAGAGYSGAAGSALGKFEATRANNIGIQAWNMTQPGLMWSANANQQANLLDWQNQAEAYKFPYTSLPGLLGGTYSSPIVNTSPSTANNIGAGILGGYSGYQSGGWPGAIFQGAGSYLGGK